MVSQIDPSVPADGVAAVKQKFRDNFAAAKSEIETLQDAVSNFPTSGFTGRRNRLINGHMVICSRGNTTVAIPATGVGTFALDRWFGQIASGGAAINMSRVLGTDPMLGVPNYSYVRLQTTTPKTPVGTDYHLFGQAVEGIHILDAKWGTAAARPLMLSFWARAGIAGTYAVRVGNDAGSSYIGSYTINNTNTWEYKTVSIPAITSGTWNNTNVFAAYLKVHFDLGCGPGRRGTPNTWLTDQSILSFAGATSICANTGAWLDLSNVQLEIDTEATPFEMPQFVLEDIVCKRYFQTTQWNMVGYVAAGGGVQTFVPWQVTMRATPTATVSNVQAINVQTPTYGPINIGFVNFAVGVATGGYSFSGSVAADAEIW